MMTPGRVKGVKAEIRVLDASGLADRGFGSLEPGPQALQSRFFVVSKV
jgi:hypothetical protein